MQEIMNLLITLRDVGQLDVRNIVHQWSLLWLEVILGHKFVVMLAASNAMDPKVLSSRCWSGANTYQVILGF